MDQMNSTIDFGFPPRPPWTRNWFDRLCAKLNITPMHVRKYLKAEMYIKELLEDIEKICRIIGLNYSIKVDWENEYVCFYRLDRIAHTSLCREISFNEILVDNFDSRTFVLSRLNYKKH